MRIRPDLTWLPRLNTTLTSLGLGTFADDTVTSFAGRNPNWAGTTSTGARIFVKHVAGDSPDATARLRRAVTAEPARFGLGTPRCIGWDTEARLIVFELLAPARTGAGLAGSGEFDEDLAGQAGRLVAALHSATIAAEPAAPFPALASFGSLTWQDYAAATAAELELWRILQTDAALPAALREVHRAQEVVRPVPTHCDLRLDQFIEHDGRLHLTDWEELRLADPARDIGAYAGEWLRHAITRLDAGQADLSHEDVLDVVAGEFAAVRPLIVAFWRSYVDTIGTVEEDLAVRATAFAGWHQYARSFAGAHANSRLPAVDRAAVGVGRAALLTPRQFARELGLGVDA